MRDEKKGAASAGQAALTTDGRDLAAEVHYPPLDNGLDYLVSVVDHLRGEEVGRRELKYAVVHLQAAVECLLKYRLELEHWSLVFKNPGDAKRSKLDDGSLDSCTVDQTVTRLVNLAGVAIGPKEEKNLKDLAKLRNQLQHYGRPHDAKVNRYVIGANAVNVLEFLIHFVDSELLPRIGPPDGDTAASLARIREGLDEIRGYVAARMRRLRPDLDPVKSRTVTCWECDQFALAVGAGEGGYCFYCHQRRGPEDIALAYAYEVLGRTTWSAVSGGLDPVYWCPLCDVEALVRTVLTAADPENPVDLCFHCGETGSGMRECARCGKPFAAADEESACDDCLHAVIATG
ncbi:hypothetical protein CUT44_08775 [Streptomyces carminius]|uniref:Uncharacterized protein n=1 Tax=Streptomyces carminius TaxID=2665496 RepID=A0A2M8M1Q6_9ACTN|nr:hypothetical protein [Streptomyces carminius]PJE98138.1 hypothetical protein CUT44_08775 [Streptomyces carminius]